MFNVMNLRRLKQIESDFAKEGNRNIKTGTFNRKVNNSETKT